MADMFADNQLAHYINLVIKNKNHYPNSELIWFNMTKNLINRRGFSFVAMKIEQAVEEVSDEQWFEHKYPKGFFNENWKFPKKKRSVIKVNLKKSAIIKKINENLKITDVAKSYGLKLKGKNKMAICPFHKDKDPSISFSDDKNIFNCFGCRVKGNIITFIKLMEELKSGDDKKRSTI